MTEPRNLTGRLEPVDPDSSPQRAELLAAMTRTWFPWAADAGFRATDDQGGPIGPFNPLLLNAPVGAAFLALQQAESAGTSLSPRTREVVILGVGAVWQAPYELYAHRAVGAHVGLSPDDVEALATGRPAPGLSEAEDVARRFTLALAADHRVGDDLYREAETAFGPAGVFDLAALAGLYLTVCAVLNVFEIPAP